MNRELRSDVSRPSEPARGASSFCPAKSSKHGRKSGHYIDQAINSLTAMMSAIAIFYQLSRLVLGC